MWVFNTADDKDGNADLRAGPGEFFGVLVDKDVESGVDHGCLQGGDTHPSVRQLWEISPLLQLQLALITLLGTSHLQAAVNYIFDAL